MDVAVIVYLVLTFLSIAYKVFWKRESYESVMFYMSCSILLLIGLIGIAIL